MATSPGELRPGAIVSALVLLALAAFAGYRALEHLGNGRDAQPRELAVADTLARTPAWGYARVHGRGLVNQSVMAHIWSSFGDEEVRYVPIVPRAWEHGEVTLLARIPLHADFPASGPYTGILKEGTESVLPGEVRSLFASREHVELATRIVILDTTHDPAQETQLGEYWAAGAFAAFALAVLFLARRRS